MKSIRTLQWEVSGHTLINLTAQSSANDATVEVEFWDILVISVENIAVRLGTDTWETTAAFVNELN